MITLKGLLSVIKSERIIKVNLYDTEGIEKTGENGFKNHLDKIVDFIHSPKLNLKDKINAIWYCINNNRLDGDEQYIQEIFKLFSGLKIPSFTSIRLTESVG